MRVVLRAGFDRFSEAGMGAIDLAVNLEKAGVDVLPVPTSILPGLPRAFTRLLEKDPAGPVDVTLAVSPDAIIVSKDGVVRHWFVGYPDRLASLAACAIVPVTVLTHGVDDEWPVTRRNPATPTTFLALGQSDALQGAWAQAATVKEFDGLLVVRGSEAMNREQVVALYHSADVLILVPGQENSRVAVEFMATGGTVISRDQQEAQNWLSADVAYPLSDSLKDLLLWCAGNRPEVVRKGALAASWIRQTHGWPVVTAKMTRVLEAL